MKSLLSLSVALLSISLVPGILLAQTSNNPVATSEAPYILTPKESPKPRINGAKVVGCRPEHPFLFTIPATGDRPMTFSAKGLPAGLSLDEKTGIITGAVQKRGNYVVRLRAKNARGSADRELTIKCGDQLALTPP